MPIPVPSDHRLTVFFRELELKNVILFQDVKQFLIVANLHRLQLPIVPLLDIDILNVRLRLNEVPHSGVARGTIHADKDAQVDDEVRRLLLFTIKAKFIESIASHSSLQELSNFGVLLQAR
mgnify:FL=1